LGKAGAMEKPGGAQKHGGTGYGGKGNPRSIEWDARGAKTTEEGRRLETFWGGGAKTELVKSRYRMPEL